LRRWCIKKNGGQESQALGRSRGGFSTKIHIAVDALGNSLRFILTAGQCHDAPQAEALIEGYATEALIADKGYDSAPLVSAVQANGVEAVIPPRSNRKEQREYDKHLYKERHLVECFINKIKHYRRVFSRFEKLSKNYLGFLSFVSALIWLH
jgi:transposase